MHHIPMYILLAWAYILLCYPFDEYVKYFYSTVKHVDINWKINLDFEDNAWIKFPEHFKDIR